MKLVILVVLTLGFAPCFVQADCDVEAIHRCVQDKSRICITRYNNTIANCLEYPLFGSYALCETLANRDLENCLEGNEIMCSFYHCREAF